MKFSVQSCLSGRNFCVTQRECHDQTVGDRKVLRSREHGSMGPGIESVKLTSGSDNRSIFNLRPCVRHVDPDSVFCHTHDTSSIQDASQIPVIVDAQLKYSRKLDPVEEIAQKLKKIKI